MPEPGPIDARDIARETGLDEVAVAAAIAQLLELGVIEHVSGSGSDAVYRRTAFGSEVAGHLLADDRRN